MSVDAAMLLLVGSAWGACVWTAGGLMPSDVRRWLLALRSRAIACGKRAASMKSGAKSEKTSLSFDAALEMYCANKTGLLSRSLARARMCWQTGMASREDALAEVARVTHVRQLESFAAAVGQAHVLGAPLADTLARQGIEMRSAHRADVERQIERAPVKLLVPTGTLILPALLLSILGPLLAASGMI